LAGKLEGLSYRIDRRGGKERENRRGAASGDRTGFSKRTLEVEAEADRLGLTGR